MRLYDYRLMRKEILSEHKMVLQREIKNMKIEIPVEQWIAPHYAKIRDCAKMISAINRELNRDKDGF